MPDKRISIFDKSQIAKNINPEISDMTKTEIFPMNSLYYLENDNS